MNNRMVAGILAHVDAGKTTLSEALLYESGVTSKLGRVDSKDAFLDNDAVERERGITIYSKNARIPVSEDGDQLILLDTPGHVDFSAEMERTLSVLDFAILLISAPSGIQAHTKTLWRLLKEYHVPTLIFVNKMDMPDCNKEKILCELKNKLSGEIYDFNKDKEELYDDLACGSEDMLNEYLENAEISTSSIYKAIMERHIFPCFFGSALRNTGVAEFLEKMKFYVTHENAIAMKNSPNNLKTGQAEDDFAALVYKISRDDKGNRLTFIKVLNGSLKVKSILDDEKINEIRVYNGVKFESVKEVSKGEICAIVGITKTQIGMPLGKAKGSLPPLLEPVMSYVIKTVENIDINRLLTMAKEIEEEDPTLHVIYEEQTREISVMLMGDVQTEVLKRRFWDRFSVEIVFSEGRVCYKETITMSVEGVGHFEPLRHYAEAHIKMEPLERGSGIEVACDVSEDILAKNWQRLITTHILEKQHRGVLVRGALTDVKFTVVTGRAHIKHTEGGDFRQATYRAIRQGLMELRAIGGCMLLEPYYDFTLEVPEEYVGKAMTDISNMNGTSEIAETDVAEHVSVLCGRAPVSTMNGYAKEVAAYTKGLGKVSFRMGGYGECHNEEEVLLNSRYDPEADLANPTGSVFCSHGAGVVIPWDQVSEYMHLPYTFDEKAMGAMYDESDEEMIRRAQNRMEILKRENSSGKADGSSDGFIGTEEIDKIIMSTAFSNAKGRTGAYKGVSAERREHIKTAYEMKKAEKRTAEEKETVYKGTKLKDKYILIDGYNVIHAWKELSDLAATSIDGAVGKLIDLMSNYQAVCGENVMVVYDAYKVKGHQLEIKKYGNITVVFTKEAQTADAYIERYAHENSKKYNITVVTSDGIEQVIVAGKGCNIVSSREFEAQVARACGEFNEMHGVQ